MAGENRRSRFRTRSAVVRWHRKIRKRVTRLESALLFLERKRSLMMARKSWLDLFPSLLLAVGYGALFIRAKGTRKRCGDL